VTDLLVPFSSPEAVAQAFHGGMLVSTIVVFVMAASAVMISRGTPPQVSFKSIGGLAAIAFIGLGAFTYSSTYGCFMAADVTGSGIRLQYAGPLVGETFVPRETIETVLFGLPGKTPGSCYIRVQQRSGKSFRSATLPMQADACKLIRTQMLAALSL
jgi:hypothetical protein